jgi:shikimate dehydrogenase
MHEAAAAAFGWKGHYQLIEIAGADAALLGKLLDGVRLLGFAGVNITYPYKEAVLPLLDELSEGARMIGAVNTVVVQHGRLIGHNTDVSGFERAAAALLAESRGPVAVIGAGGVGKAAAVAMAKSGVRGLRIFDLDPRKAAALAETVAPLTDSVVAETVAEAVFGASGVVNGTPVGMLPSRESPVDPALLRADLWVADAVYYPLCTRLLAAAQKIGAKTLNGRALAIHQAVDAFELFTSVKPSVEVMSAAFDAVLEGRTDR